MSHRDRWIYRHLRRLHLGQFLQRAAEWLGGFLFIFGTAVLLTKVLFPGLWPHVLWIAVGAVPAAVVAWILSRRGRFNRQESVAMLDRSLGAGGLLMTLSESPHAEWESRLPQVERLWRDSLPRIRPGRFAGYVGLPLLFAVGVCFLPVREITANPVEPKTVARQAAEELQQMLELLEETDVLDEEQKQELEEEIARLTEEADESPLTSERWETVDALEQRMRLKLEESAALAENAAASAALLAEAATGNLDQLSAERLEQLEQDLLETLQNMRETGALNGAPQSLRDQLERLSKNGRFQNLPRDAAARSDMLNSLQQFLEQEQRKLAEARSKCQGACEGEGKCSRCGGACNGGLCGNCLGERNGQGSSSIDGDGSPGRGGINRGRGDADLTWGDESDEQGSKFKETVLPPGFQEDPKDEVRGVSLAPPDEEPADSAPRTVERDIEPASGRETWDRRLRPRHRDVVRKFFDSGATPAE